MSDKVDVSTEKVCKECGLGISPEESEASDIAHLHYGVCIERLRAHIRDQAKQIHSLEWMRDGLMAENNQQLAKITQLEDQLEEEERACLEVIGQRDHANKSLQETHIALGGNGEWCGKLPPEEPPNSGDLSLDVPELAAEIKHKLWLYENEGRI